jgi:hypothetical protein
MKDRLLWLKKKLRCWTPYEHAEHLKKQLLVTERLTHAINAP